MPDVDAIDPLACAFAQFTVDAPREVTMPGSSAARATVRRRRAVNAIVGCVLAVILAGGGVAYASSVHTRRQAVPAASVSASPSPADEAALGTLAAGDVAGFSDAAKVFVSSSGPLDEAFERDESSGGRGAYVLTIECRGVGSLKVVWQLGAKTQTVTYACGSGAASDIHAIHANHTDSYGNDSVTLYPDAAAQSHAGYAYTIARA
jgi:hypothetical protein